METTFQTTFSRVGFGGGKEVAFFFGRTKPAGSLLDSSKNSPPLSVHLFYTIQLL